MAEQCLSLVVPETSLTLADNTLVIGREFPDVETCRRTLKDIAIALHFDLRIVKSDRSRFIAKCSKEGCPWRVHVAKCPGVPTFSIRTLIGEHTCEGVQNLHHQQASVGWVARSVEDRIRNNPQYKPKEILQDIQDQHGVAVSYMQAWRGKERSMAALHGTFEEGYGLLAGYCEQLRKANPGSIATVYATGDNCFQRIFISYQASIYGFLNACRPLLEIDRAHLKGKYLGALLCAAAIDADDALFPLAIAIVDVESDENWMWFMSELRKLLGVNTDSMPRLTILSERQRGMVEAVETHFPSAFHGFCLRYVSENFRDTFKNPKLVNIFWNAVYSLTPVEFESKISEMVDILQDVIPWFRQFPPQLWAVAYFEGVRYGHFTLGVTELLYNWALEGHELPIVQMMEHIRHQLTSWFNDRRAMSMRWNSVLVPSAEKRIQEAIADAPCYQVLRANEVEFEIVSTERTNIVHIQTRVCSCHRWQLYGLPCAHAAAALISCGQNAQLFADHCFTVHSYRETYSQIIYPIPDKCMWKELGDGTEGGGVSLDNAIRAPKIRRPPGRPKKKVLRVESLKRPKRVVQCGRCRMLGHSQKKCTLPV
ncbi:putative Short-chain dehydrogenase-reductase B [Heracleum sosnowskyi]|uniref:Short-chain dehydrogenase-reductase B n=1 Tax=Heracleum sosnowskyi TaxID=360622 RepID=A0AAD8IG49_9APIA|nr:putative Short-chain dehydrogenase-reductase B [Heracleum sosnowskyi]